MDADSDITGDRRNCRPKGFPSVFGFVVTLSFPSIPYYHPRLILTRLCHPIVLHHSLRLPVFTLLVCITDLYEICLFAFFDTFFVRQSFSISLEWLAGQRCPSSPSHTEYTRDCFAPATHAYQFCWIWGVSSVNRRDSPH
ncbi:hypothetical protein BS47DRAFT_879493 [Hydnum rufescens UP504]|uniref:Uncharacterized protein n=1 Tax=Hydnum rufescens UP504 TaxID=1448309 RepID=A0A9P6ABU9_9AGAM|nr:hypothetical protein BS47DRAFT_879493 [Hydnum rufescens UP504]